MTRTQKLEEAVRAALRLRRFIEVPGKVKVISLLVPADEVAKFDEVIAKLATVGQTKAKF